MKKNLLLLLVCSPLALIAQQDKFYLVMGHPYPHISTQFPGIIFELKSDSLVEIKRFSEPSLLLENIRYYPEINYLSIVTKEHRKREGERVLEAISVNDSISTILARVKFEDFSEASCIKSELIKFNQYEVYDCFTCPDIKNKKLRHFGINIYTGRAREIFPKDFAYSLISGSPGGALEAWDIQLLYTNPNDGKLVIPKTPKIEERPPYPLVVPNSFQLGEKARVAVHISNNYFTAINMKIEDSNQESIGMSHFIIFNKQAKEWHQWKIEGSSTVVRGFDKWIWGNVVASNVILVFDEKDRLKEKIPLNRASPGKEERRKNGTETGTPFDLRANFFDSYYPGILFVHDIITGTTIKWSTYQGDSEVLLVNNRMVFYRVNDKIYAVPILDDNNLGKPKLLIRDDRIPDIHWAFFGVK